MADICTWYIHVCVCNVHLPVFHCVLYNRSSEGVNLFCCSSSIVGRKPPSNAAVCDILLPVVATGTGSLLSNLCSLSKPACSWLSKPLINLLMASSVSAASGLAPKKSVGHETLFRQLVMPCTYIVCTCTYIVCTCTLLVHQPQLLNACSAMVFSTTNASVQPPGSYIQCYRTGISNSVYRLFRQVHTL